MQFNQNWIYFQEKGEEVTGTISEFKQTKNGKDFAILENCDINRQNSVEKISIPQHIFININRYQRGQLQKEKRYTFKCTDAKTRFFDIIPAQHESWEIHDEVNETEYNDTKDIVKFLTEKYEETHKQAEYYRKLLEKLGGL